MTRPSFTLTLPVPPDRARRLLAEAIELLQQVMREDPYARERITVWLLARRDDGTLEQLRRQYKS